MSSAPRSVALWMVASLALAACDRSGGSSSSNVETLPERGRLEATIGSLDPLTFGLSGADCRTISRGDRSELRVQAYGTKRFELPDRTIHPHLVSATLPADLGDDSVTFGADGDHPWSIVASLLDVTLRGDAYEMLQLIGTRAEGTSPDFQCEASRTDDRLELTCRGVRPVPWYAPGDIPEASFEASMPCRDGT